MKIIAKRLGQEVPEDARFLTAMYVPVTKTRGATGFNSEEVNIVIEDEKTLTSKSEGAILYFIFLSE